jgi:uncharacterized protein DUF2213
LLAYTGSKLSDNIIRDNAGFLICSAPVCRSGWYSYRRSEIDSNSNSDEMVRVWRDPAEITKDAVLASIEGKPLTLSHPTRFVDPTSWSWTVKGHLQNARIGPPDTAGNVQVFADVHIQDSHAIDRVNAGLRQLSLGYDYELVAGPEPGTFAQRKLRINHCALVSAGRAGTAQIVDEDGEVMNERLDRIVGLLEKLLALKPEKEAATADTADPDLIATAVTPKSAASLPKTGAKPDTLGKLTSAPRSDENNLHPIASVVPTSGGAGTNSEVDEDGGESDVVGPTAIPNSRVIDGLRALRPYVIASRDATSIHSFNAAMVAAKAGNALPAKRLLTAFDRARPADLSGVFEDAVRSRREQLLAGQQAGRAAQRHCRPSLVATDHDDKELSFEEQVNARREQLLAGQK